MVTDSLEFVLENTTSGVYKFYLITAVPAIQLQIHTRQPQDVKLPLVMNK